MKNNSYLYGEDVEVPEIPEYVIMRRVELLKDNLESLYKLSYLERDTERIREVNNAIHFWESLNSR